MTQLEDCIEKLQTVPNDTNRMLRHIRELDKRIEEGTPKLGERQREFLEKVRERKQDTHELEAEHAEILALQKLYYGMALEKVKVAEQLKEVLAEASAELEARVKAEAKVEKAEEASDNREAPLFKKKKVKGESRAVGRAADKKEKEWVYDKYVPAYCYCGQGSFGEMVECEYPFCEREWFHKDCVGEKIMPEQEWWCANCRKLKDVTNATSMKFFFK